MPLLSERALLGETVVNMTNTAGWTRPATVSLMSGLRWEERYLAGGDEALDESTVTTLAESLQSHGWHTYLNSANPALGDWLSQGFEEQVFSDKGEESAPQRFDAVLEQLSTHEEPVLAWLQLMELHVPFGPMADSCAAEVQAAAALCPEELFDIGAEVTYAFIDFTVMSDEERAACGAAIHVGQSCAATQLDAELDAFLSALPADALVAVTTDHGEGWLDPKTDHNWTLNQKISRGFLALFDAQGVPGEYALASQVDLAPTLLDRLGVSPPEGQFEGVPLGEPATGLVKAWRCAPQSLTVETAIWEGDSLGIKIRRPGGKVSYELYDTLLDPNSDTDLAASVTMSTTLAAALEEQFASTEALCVEGSDW